MLVKTIFNNKCCAIINISQDNSRLKISIRIKVCYVGRISAGDMASCAGSVLVDLNGISITKPHLISRAEEISTHTTYEKQHNRSEMESERRAGSKLLSSDFFHCIIFKKYYVSEAGCASVFG